jgi:hypothetical protein
MPQASWPRFTICFFSKHLPDLGYHDLGKTLHDAGFDGRSDGAQGRPRAAGARRMRR